MPTINQLERPAVPATPSSSVVTTSVRREMEESFLEYSMSVIVSRALPDVRDGLKPVHRRILYTMHDMGVRPDKSTLKCARVVGEVMGKLHPHGDAAIYDALVHQAQDWYLRLPLVTGQGNFGSLGGEDPAAAMRYTECKMAPAALGMLESIDEGTVDFRPTYDGKAQEPTVLPAAFPNLLVNGGEGIAVGMATKMAPHNLVEVIGGVRALIDNPNITLDELMAHIPGPDLPSGGSIIGTDGIKEAYATGRGSFRMRATAQITDVTPRRKGIVVTELPYQVGPEKIISRIKDLVNAKRLQGVSDVRDLTGMKTGLRLVIECKTGFNPAAVLEELYKSTDLECNFGINNVALVNNQPQTLGLLALCKHYLNHRLEVTTRRTRFRLNKAEARAHIVEGLVIALDAIDEVVRIIRASDDTAQARAELMRRFKLTELQTDAILEMTLRRLTSLEVNKLKDELAELRKTIADLTALLADEARMRALVSDELSKMSDLYGTPRRTRLLDQAPAAGGFDSLETPDEPCRVTLTASGLIGRTAEKFKGTPGRHDAITATVDTNTRGTIGAITSRGRLLRVPVVELQQIAGRARGAAIRDVTDLQTDENVIGLTRLADGPGIVLLTRRGVIKRLAPDYGNKPSIDIISLKDDDQLVLAQDLATGQEDLVAISSDAQLLRFTLEAIRPQGRSAGGVAGMKLGDGARIIAAGTVPGPGSDDAHTVTTITDRGTAKTARAADYPVKGRGGSGVRCHKFLRGETELAAAYIGSGTPVALTTDGDLLTVPAELGKRDGSGLPLADEARTIAAAGAQRT